jgi:Spy/CpxP family protein refolding chaperone
MRQVKLAIAATVALAGLMGFGTIASALPGDGMGPGGPGMRHGKGMQCDKRGGHRMGPGARLDIMTAHLGLTPEQRYKILPILDEQFKEMRAVRADDKLTRAQTREKMQAIHAKCFDSIKGILTPEQQKKADEMKRQFGERCKQRQAKMGKPLPAAQK